MDLINGLSYLLASLSRFLFQIYYFNENTLSTAIRKASIELTTKNGLRYR